MDSPPMPSPTVSAATSRPARVAPNEVIAGLRERRAEVARMLAELRGLHQTAHAHHQKEADGWRREHERLRQLLAERERELAATGDRLRAAETHAAQLEEVQQELLAHSEEVLWEQREELARVVADLRQLGPATFEAPPAALLPAQPEGPDWKALLAEREGELADAIARAHSAEGRAEQVEPLRTELQSLRRQLEQKESIIQQLRTQNQRSSPTAGGPEVAAYEAELAEYHRQLEADRQELNTEIRRLQERNAELNQSVRDVEQERARERAQLYGETHIDRAFADLAQRDRDRARAGQEVRNKALPVLRLKEKAAP